jgi:hypothetical protein
MLQAIDPVTELHITSHIRIRGQVILLTIKGKERISPFLPSGGDVVIETTPKSTIINSCSYPRDATAIEEFIEEGAWAASFAVTKIYTKSVFYRL